MRLKLLLTGQQPITGGLAGESQAGDLFNMMNKAVLTGVSTARQSKAS